MRFHEIYLKNLLSFKEANLRMNQTNIIVGPNNAGKTNILRILKLFINNATPLNVQLNKSMKNDPSERSEIGFEVELSDQEAVILFRQFLRNKHLKEIGEGFKKLRLLVRWNNTIDDYSYINFAIMRFENNMTVINGGPLTMKGEPLTVFFREYKSWNLLSNPDLGGLSSLAEGHEKLFEVLDKVIQNGSKAACRIGETGFFKHFFGASLTKPNRTEIDAETFEFLGVDKTQLEVITIWNFIGKLMSNSMVIMDDVRPTPESLARSMQELKDTCEEDYDNLRNKFQELFPNVSFRVQKTENISSILISEDGRGIPLDKSASGYLSGMSLLFMIHGGTEKTVFFDEPETHFHPPKLRVLSRKLAESSECAKNQLTLITHAPALIDTSILQHDLTNVIYMRKERAVSKICQPQEKVPIRVKEHLFSPEVFLGSGCVIVEGITDEYVIKGISDSHERLLARSSITIVNLGGKGSIDSCIALLRSYEIPHVAIADSDYEGDLEGVVKLEGDIEREVERLGWDRKGDANVGKEKLTSEKAYPLIMQLLESESGKKKLKETRLWEALDIITKAAVS